MLTPSSEIIQLLAVFAPLFTQPTFQKVQLLIFGTMLAPGKRTITAVLRVMGLEQAANFGKYHRVLNQAAWSPMWASRLLLWLLVTHFVPPGVRLVILVDETLERRAGKKIDYKGWFRDAVRSTGPKVVTSRGIRWLCLCLLVSVPWSTREWALPFLVVPLLSEKTCQKLKKRHRSGVEWTARLLAKIVVWLPESQITLVGDGGFAAVELVACCQRLGVGLVARLRLDAQLYDFAGERPASKRGPKPKKGERQPNLQARLADPQTRWEPAIGLWYGGQDKQIEYVSDVCLWYTPGHDPVPIRWVLVRYEETNAKTGKVSVKAGAFLCSDTQEPTLLPLQILAWFVRRWNIEVLFEEMRAHLGLETQRHWSVRAIGRTTPCLFGVFSLVVLMAKALHPKTLPVQESRWYRKEEATFSDVLGAVRLHLWSAMNYTQSASQAQECLIPRAIWQRIQQIVCYAA
jgi:DDE superfamily endonuclease